MAGPYQTLATDFIAELRRVLPNRNLPTVQFVPVTVNHRINNMDLWQHLVVESPDPEAFDQFILELVFGHGFYGRMHQAGVFGQGRRLANRVRYFRAIRTQFVLVSNAIVYFMLIPMKNKGPAPGFWRPAIVGATQRSPTFKRNLLIRDRHQCHLTLRHDRSSLQPNPHPVELIGAHIIPFSLANKPAVHLLLEAFSGSTIQIAWIANAGINNIRNGFLLQHDAHVDFDNFRWGLRCTNAAGAVRYTPTHIRMNAPLSFSWQHLVAGEVTFGPNNPPLPLPQPQLCNLHYAIGRVMSLSGAGDVIDRYYEDRDQDPEAVFAAEKEVDRKDSTVDEELTDEMLEELGLEELESGGTQPSQADIIWNIQWRRELIEGH